MPNLVLLVPGRGELLDRRLEASSFEDEPDFLRDRQCDGFAHMIQTRQVPSPLRILSANNCSSNPPCTTLLPLH